MKLTLSVLQRHVRDLHVAVVLAVAVPCYAAFSATELPSQKICCHKPSGKVCRTVKFVVIVAGFFRCHTIHLAGTMKIAWSTTLCGTHWYRWGLFSRYDKKELIGRYFYNFRTRRKFCGTSLNAYRVRVALIALYTLKFKNPSTAGLTTWNRDVPLFTRIFPIFFLGYSVMHFFHGCNCVILKHTLTGTSSTH